MASRPLGEVGVAVDATIDPLLKKFAAAEAAADAFYRRMSGKVRVPIGGGAGGPGGAANDNAAKAADRIAKAMEGAARAATRYHQALGTVSIDLRANAQVTQANTAALERLTRSIDENSRALDRQARGARGAREATRGMDQASQDLKRTLLGSAGLIAGAFGLNEIKNTADSYTRFTNQLKVAGLAGTALAGTQDQLFGSAQKYGVELESLGTLYGRLAQSQNALGATSQQMMQFTNGVAAAIKVQGAGANEVRGALLQLSQAMGSPIVRAEEFNSVNEGARPILQAVANGIEKYGGSIAKLRTDVINGKLTSQEFFQGFLNGSAQLETQATQANLTIGASFTTLNNALGRYIGQTDQSLSATQRIGGAIAALARNLDVVMPILTALILSIGSRYLVAAGSMVASTTLVQGALFAIQARAADAATTMEALAFAGATAGRSMLAAFGGPVGVAVLAIAAAVYFFHQRTAEAAAEVERFNTHQREATKILADERQRASAAGGAVRALGSDHATATNSVRSFAGATGDAAKALDQQARAARRARFELLANAFEQAKADKAAADARIEAGRQSDSSRARFGNLPESSDVQEARGRSAAAAKTMAQLQTAMDKAVRDPLESYVPNARTQGRDIPAEIADLQRQLVGAQKAHNDSAQRELLKQIKIRQRITTLLGQGLSFDIANAQAETEALGGKGSTPEDGSIRFRRPVAGGRVSGRLGEQRAAADGVGAHQHAGTDYAVPVGTRVSAAASGTVIEAGTLPGYGNVVIIDHGRGMTTRYAHLSRLGVAKGARVDAGDEIGLSGGARGAAGSGNSRGAHLHYEVRKNGKPVDPNGLYATDEVDAANTAERLENERLTREQAFGSAQQQMNDAILAARQEQLVDEAQISAAAIARVQGERDRERDEIEQKRQRGQYTDDQAKALTALNEQVRDAQTAALQLKERHRLEEVALRTAADQHDRQIEQLQAAEDLARTAVERRAIERRILAAQKEYERQVLQATIDSPFTKPEDRATAQRGLDTLDSRYAPKSAKIDQAAIEDMFQTGPDGTRSGYRDQERQIGRDRDDKLASVDEGTTALLDNEQLTQEQREKILQEAADRRVDIEADASKRILDLETARKTAQLSSAQEIAEGLASIAEGIAGKQSAIYRGLFATAKAFAIAQASIALYQNIAEASKIGFPQNLPLIAAAVSQGASIIANVQAIGAQFDVGGWTGDGPRHAAAGTVHGQEFVVRAGPAARHRATLEDINEGRDPTMRLRSAGSAEGGLMQAGRQQGRVMVKQMPGVAIEYREGLGTGEVEIIVKRAVEKHAPSVVSRDMSDPNSRTSKALRRTTTAGTRKS